MKKNILIILLCVISCGCSVKSEIKMDVDGKINESVTILEDSSYFKKFMVTKKDYIENMISKYQVALDKKGYKYDIVEKSRQSGSTIYNNYDDICSYFGNSYFNQYVYKYFKCTENELFYEITNATEYIPYCSDCSDWPRLEDVVLEISLPISASEHNADEVNNNKYVWKFGKDAPNYKTFYLKINKASLQENYQNYLKQLERNKIKKILIIIITIVGSICVIAVFISKLNKKYKKNKLEY